MKKCPFKLKTQFCESSAKDTKCPSLNKHPHLNQVVKHIKALHNIIKGA